MVIAKVRNDKAVDANELPPMNDDNKVRLDKEYDGKPTRFEVENI